jgi:hypothetical protein
MNFSLSDLACTDAPSTHTREISVECESCKAVFDVPLEANEEFSDVHPDDVPECCGDEDFGIAGNGVMG